MAEKSIGLTVIVLVAAVSDSHEDNYAKFQGVDK